MCCSFHDGISEFLLIWGNLKDGAVYDGTSTGATAEPESLTPLDSILIMASLKNPIGGKTKLPLAFTITVSTPFQSNVVYY